MDGGAHRRHRPGSRCRSAPRPRASTERLAKRATASSGARIRRRARASTALSGSWSSWRSPVTRQTGSPAPGSAASVPMGGGLYPAGGGEARTRPGIGIPEVSAGSRSTCQAELIARHPLTDPDRPCASRLSTCPPSRSLSSPPAARRSRPPLCSPDADPRANRRRDRLDPGLRLRQARLRDAPARVRGGDPRRAHRGRGRWRRSSTRSSPEAPTGTSWWPSSASTSPRSASTRRAP